jgi:hypothetical protein
LLLKLKNPAGLFKTSGVVAPVARIAVFDAYFLPFDQAC